MNTEAVNYQTEWLNGRELAAYLRMDYRYTTEKLCYTPGFPKPIRLTPRGNRRWLKTDIDRWIESRRGVPYE